VLRALRAKLDVLAKRFVFEHPDAARSFVITLREADATLSLRQLLTMHFMHDTDTVVVTLQDCQRRVRKGEGA